MRRHLHSHSDVTGAEDLDRQAWAHGAAAYQLFRAHLAALREELREPTRVDHLVLGAERVLEALQLRQPHVDRHLAALEPAGHRAARARALGAAARGLSLRTLTTADAGLCAPRAGRGSQMVH